MRFAICDDEKLFRNEIKKTLDKYSKERHIDVLYDEFSNGHELLACKNEYDIIFMDYQMDSIDGLETAKKLREKNNNTDIIFITSFPQIVFDTFQYNTFRFLVKPIDYEKFCAALDDYRKIKNTEIFIIIKTDDITKKIPASQIIYAEASDKYCYIRTAEENFLYKKTLSELEEILPKDIFFRCHRSYIVNFRHIVSHTNTDITLDNQEKALISKMKASSFKKTFVEFIKRTNNIQ